ncbi:expressed unknown protein [Seminavis robusta]|uniref:Uncharacterized protein n=1 Tax=Seminavis robusta TaxID=568900 RepID=A0A9N8E3R8_9STRA|nr:expressed unknown protein [Seminavis robusta]|eukprot:Sro523_g159750.1 n/a (588) ;mRNA; f:25151-26998
MASATVAASSSRRTSRPRYRHPSTRIAIWVGLMFAVTGATMNFSKMVGERLVDLNLEDAFLLLSSSSTATSNTNIDPARRLSTDVTTASTFITNNNYINDLATSDHTTTIPQSDTEGRKEKMERTKQDLLAKIAAIENKNNGERTRKPHPQKQKQKKHQAIAATEIKEKVELPSTQLEPVKGSKTIPILQDQTNTPDVHHHNATMAAINTTNVIVNLSDCYLPLPTGTTKTNINLWDNSTVLAPWLKEYFAWHQQQRAQLTPDNWQQQRFLIPVARKGQKNGGMTDRIRPLPAYLRLAAQTRRIFLIHWGRPFPLEEFMLPPVGGLDWRVPEYMLKDVIATGPRTEWENIVSTANNTEPILLTAKYQSWNYGEIWYKEQTAEGEAAVSHAFREIWKVVFTPSPPVAQRIQNDMRQMKLIPGEFATAHIRALYAVKDRPDDKIREMAMNAMNCASMLRPGGPFFVASDSSLAIQTAMSYGRQKNVTVVTANHHHSKKQPLHVDFHNESDTSVTPENFYDGFVDLHLMAATRCVSVGPGGFARWGHLLGYNDTCVIHHNGRYPSEEERNSIQQQASKRAELPRFPMPML